MCSLLASVCERLNFYWRESTGILKVCYKRYDSELERFCVSKTINAAERISVRHLCRIARKLSVVEPKVQKAKLSERGRNPRERSDDEENICVFSLSLLKISFSFPRNKRERNLEIKNKNN